MSFEAFVKKARPLVPANAEVRELELANLKEGRSPSYNKIKSSFRKDIAAHGSRFMLSDLVSNQLSVEAEEQARFDKKVKEEVERQIAALRDQAHKEGYAAGSQAGKDQAYQEEKARLAQVMESLASAANTLATAKNRLGEQYHGALVEMAFKLARIIVHKEIKERPEIISHTVEAILHRISKEDDVQVRISNKEFEAIEAIGEDIKKLARNGRVNFEVDATLASGDCIVESQSGEIASFIEEKFTKLKLEVEKAIRLDLEGTGT